MAVCVGVKRKVFQIRGGTVRIKIRWEGTWREQEVENGGVINQGVGALG